MGDSIAYAVLFSLYKSTFCYILIRDFFERTDMLFNSYIFIFIFIPVVLGGWYTLNHFGKHKLSMAFLLGMSLWFYGFFNPSYLLIILSSIGINYLISFFLDRTKNKGRFTVYLCGLLFNICLLLYFKYYDFFVENINIVFKSDFDLKHILLPLGISFFTFQQISFITDRYRNETKHCGILEYAVFVSFFPQLVAGPIVTYDEMIPQFKDQNKRKFNPESFAKGICLFSVGLAKKVLIADVLGLIVNKGHSDHLLMDSFSTFVVMLFYALELYFDFSGYSDMAIGLGRMFNIELPQNFNSPYKATGMKSFWNRWHITLSRFLFKYIYIPLGGNRKGKIRTFINIFIVFLISGFWHGANMTFVIWGIMQGLGVMFDRLKFVGVDDDEKRKPKIKVAPVIGRFFTFNYYAVSLVFFRSDNLKVAARMFKNLMRFDYSGYFTKLLPSIEIPEIYLIKQGINLLMPNALNVFYAVFLVLFFAMCIFILTRKNSLEIIDGGHETKTLYIWAFILFVWSVISFSGVSTFIYFNF